MTPTKSCLVLAIVACLSLLGCSEPRDSRSPTTKPVDSQARGSRMLEYRLALNAYVGGRQEIALRHFQAAAELGHVNAQFYTGLMYANGEGTKRNYTEAAKWYQKAAAHNQPDALIQLARFYATGTVVKLDVRKAIELLNRASQHLPAGEKRDQAVEQRDALVAILPSGPDSAAK